MKHKFIVVDKDGDVYDAQNANCFDDDTKEYAFKFAKYHAQDGNDCAVYVRIATAGRPTEIKFEEEV